MMLYIIIVASNTFHGLVWWGSPDLRAAGSLLPRFHARDKYYVRVLTRFHARDE
jgi:hypothetical protein